MLSRFTITVSLQGAKYDCRSVVLLRLFRHHVRSVCGRGGRRAHDGFAGDSDEELGGQEGRAGRRAGEIRMGRRSFGKRSARAAERTQDNGRRKEIRRAVPKKEG